MCVGGQTSELTSMVARAREHHEIGLAFTNGNHQDATSVDAGEYSSSTANLAGNVVKGKMRWMRRDAAHVRGVHGSYTSRLEVVAHFDGVLVPGTAAASAVRRVTPTVASSTAGSRAVAGGVVLRLVKTRDKDNDIAIEVALRA